MGNNIIKITGIDKNTTPWTLLMDNAGNATVKAGDLVTWNIVGNNTEIASISISLSSTNSAMFSSAPTDQGGPAPDSWQGTIASDALNGPEGYTITFQAVGNPEYYHHDPTIQVNN